ncbi:MAG: GFA family protein [Gammaproteobacteria bacterium]|nr:GFA family protein [Gammaproteobacteria bacterium]
MCRKFHGAAFATFGEVAIEDFRWLTGESALKVFIAANGTVRKFCGQCGASLIFKSKNDQGTTVEFTLGTLDSDISQHPDSHIFVGSKANWFEISDDLPQFNQGRD